MKTLVTTLLATLFATGSIFLGILYTQHVQELKKRDPHYTITHIIHSGELDTAHLIDCLGIGIGENLYLFDVKQAEERLKKLSYLEKIHVEKSSPDALKVVYSLRIPVAISGLFSNTGIDAGGHTFPLRPFYSEQTLPTLYYENHPREALALLAHQEILFRSIDILDIHAPSLGQRQIVAVTEEGHTLRLPVSNYLEALSRYRRLLPHIEQDPQVIDLRLSRLAFLEKI